MSWFKKYLAPRAPRAPKALKNQKFIFQNKKKKRKKKWLPANLKTVTKSNLPKTIPKVRVAAGVVWAKQLISKEKKEVGTKAKKKKNGGLLFNRNHLPKLRLRARVLLVKKLKKKMMATTMTIMIRRKHK